MKVRVSFVFLQPMQTDRFDINGEFRALHGSYPICARRPVIGITANFADGKATLAEAYYRSVLEAGGVPLLIPPYPEREALLETLSRVDAVLLTGGADIDPRYMNEEPDYSLLHGINPPRDEQELLLALLADARSLPILGICRGVQTIAAAFGGSVHQDIYAALGQQLLAHDQEPVERGVATHDVIMKPGSRLARIFGSRQLAVNTFHHQAVSRVPSGFEVVATSPDGVIEGIEAIDGRSIIGVQWHPESFIMNGDECMMPLFRWLVDEAALYVRVNELHEKMLTIDSHCDTPMLSDTAYRLGTRDEVALVDLHKMNEGLLDATTMVAYIPQGARDAESLAQATAKADALLAWVATNVADNATAVSLCSTPKELLELKSEGKRAIMLGVENGYAIGLDIKNIERLRRGGVVYMTLCHNGDNDICDSARGNAEHGGLSVFGREVVAEMNRVGMMIDLSHAAESTFWQVLECSALPVVCSHSSCRVLCDHPRNLTDEQMRALAAKGGVVQVTMYSGFLCKEGDATLDDFLRHLQHAIDVAGIDHVGIGTDFDGDGKVQGCSSASQLRNVTRELLRRGYSHADIEKIWGGNWLRVMQQVQAAGI